MYAGASFADKNVGTAKTVTVEVHGKTVRRGLHRVAGQGLVYEEPKAEPATEGEDAVAESPE